VKLANVRRAELARGINLGEQFGLPGEVVSHLAALPLAQLDGARVGHDEINVRSASVTGA
jgi:hypothetical protein